MTVAYWETVGGTLVEEFCAVGRTKDRGGRSLDAIILPDGEKRRVPLRERRLVSVKGHRVIVVQAKNERLGMNVMGQAYFSKFLVERLGAASVKTVALCTKDDEVLGPIARAHEIEVVVMPPAPPTAT
jgi:hypothetical protein